MLKVRLKVIQGSEELSSIIIGNRFCTGRYRTVGISVFGSYIYRPERPKQSHSEIQFVEIINASRHARTIKNAANLSKYDHYVLDINYIILYCLSS